MKGQPKAPLPEGSSTEPLENLSIPDESGKLLNLATTLKSGTTLVYFFPKADTPG